MSHGDARRVLERSLHVPLKTIESLRDRNDIEAKPKSGNTYFSFRNMATKIITYHVHTTRVHPGEQNKMAF